MIQTVGVDRKLYREQTALKVIVPERPPLQFLETSP
jgi:hypothetical protein